ncbi:hypothetical protein PFICI_10892 [Pestalotiopsis fici W106-1]|uniref:Xylanolytic transcriptional activator regulatory domain-containing protein n=1 Tax=Pestalotiopsis fici (strain W106-1 / CGMCC3.15140) TaxID=1229662 RepID=W3WT15_PESFW|nr:uncharacterized protein PFICI_10892 [Pestalotiopsis fici W106-1]ETS77018.1 hypothetical protein PFICI_10892 [Pestalotiopsis fici W106-1]
MPEEKDPLPGREASMFYLHTPQPAVFLCARDQKFTERPFGTSSPAYTPAPRRPSKDVSDISEESYSPSPVPERSTPASLNSGTHTDSTNSRPRPDQTDIARGIRTYFSHCHRQPIWCFEREDVSNFASLPDELVYSILALTSHFSPRQISQPCHYGNDARHLIMLRIANGAVSLPTIESLCLLSYSTFIDGNPHLGQFHLGLAIQLCRSAMLDMESIYTGSDPTMERKKKLFWSLQLLEHFYGRPNGLPSIPVEIGRPSYGPAGGVHGFFSDLGPKTPPLPTDSLGTSTPDEPGIWNTGLRLGWVWSRVRKYVSDCSQNILKEPWRHDSTYAMVCSDFLETENRIPMCHRYDSVKFYERKRDELRSEHDYWAAWLKEQFTYHSIPTVLNHPFLYIVGAQHNPNLAIPNTFWRRSSELALIHATWIVRIIDMIVDKQVKLTDPFFAHMAAIAATVHLYYCCAAAARLKHKSHTDFAKCRQFLKSFTAHSAACAALDHNLDRMTRIAADSDNMDGEDWMPSKLNLSVPLMWDILQFNCMTMTPATNSVDLLDASLTPTMAQEDLSECTLLEIVVASSPEINVDTTDGGQTAPLASSASTKPDTPRNMVWNETNLEPTDNLTFNTTPWLYADLSQFASLGDLGLLEAQSGMNDNRAQQPWWEGGNFSNATFY